MLLASLPVQKRPGREWMNCNRLSVALCGRHTALRVPANAWQVQHEVPPEVQPQLVHWRLVLVLHVHPVHVLHTQYVISVLNCLTLCTQLWQTDMRCTAPFVMLYSCLAHAAV